MSFKPTDKQIKFVKETLEYWSPILQTDYFDIDIRHMDGPSLENEEVVAECDSSPSYRSAVISIYPPFWNENMTKEKQDKALLHELCHILTRPYSLLVERGFNLKPVTVEEEGNVDEHLTSWITNIVFTLDKRD